MTFLLLAIKLQHTVANVAAIVLVVVFVCSSPWHFVFNCKCLTIFTIPLSEGNLASGVSYFYFISNPSVSGNADWGENMNSKFN